MSARANTEEVGDGDSSTEDVSFSPSDEKVVRAALHSRNLRLQEHEDDLTPGSTAVLRALSADGDLRWLSNVGNVNEMFRRLSNCLSVLTALTCIDSLLMAGPWGIWVGVRMNEKRGSLEVH